MRTASTTAKARTTATSRRGKPATASKSLKFPSSNNTNSKIKFGSSKRRRFALRFCCLLITLCLALFLSNLVRLDRGDDDELLFHSSTREKKWTTTKRTRMTHYHEVNNNNKNSDDNNQDNYQYDEDDQEMKKMTVLITTFKQPYCLLRQLSHLQKCTNVVEAIHVNWFQGQGHPPPNVTPSLLSSMLMNTTYSSANNNSRATNLSVPVIFDKLPNRLSYRFYPRPFPTKGIFNIDVDSGYSCEALELAFHTWKKQHSSKSNQSNNTHHGIKHYYSTPVGFHPRYLSPYEYYQWRKPYQFPHKRNTLFVTKGAIVHRDVFEYYFSPEFSKLRELADMLITGEDMLMSFVLSDIYNQYKYDADMKISHNATTTQTQLQLQPSFISICHDSFQGCEQKCKGVRSLNSRTSKFRPEFLNRLFRFFGHNVFENTTMAFGQEESSTTLSSSWQNYLASFSLQSSTTSNKDVNFLLLEKNTSSSLSMVWQEKNNGTVTIWKKSENNLEVQVCGSYEGAKDEFRCGHEYFDPIWVHDEPINSITRSMQKHKPIERALENSAANKKR